MTERQPSPKRQLTLRAVNDGDDSDWSDDENNNIGSDEEDKMQVDERLPVENNEDSDDQQIDSKALFGDLTSSSDEDEGNQETEKANEGKREQITAVEDSNNNSDEDDEKKIKQRLFGDDDDDDESSGIGSAKEMVDDDDVTGSSRNPREAITLDLELKETKPLDGRQVYLLKVPNFLHFDPRPFDADTFEGESGEEEDQEGLRQRIKLKVDNTVRWRFRNSKGSKQLSLSDENIQSNARFVRWSDGTMSLMLGQECFDCNLTKLGDQYQYLYLRDPQSTVLQARTKLQQSMVMRPYGTGSRTHKKLTATVLQRHKKTTKTKSYSLIADPEAAKQQAERLEQEKIRNRKRLESRQTRYMELTEDALEAEEGFGASGQRKRFRTARRDATNRQRSFGQDINTDEEDDFMSSEGEDDGLDGFIVDDDDDENEEDAETGAEESGDESERGEIDWEAERAKEQRIMAAKSSTVDTAAIADKKRRLLIVDDDEQE